MPNLVVKPIVIIRGTGTFDCFKKLAFAFFALPFVPPTSPALWIKRLNVSKKVEVLASLICSMNSRLNSGAQEPKTNNAKNQRDIDQDSRAALLNFRYRRSSADGSSYNCSKDDANSGEEDRRLRVDLLQFFPSVSKKSFFVTGIALFT